MRTENYAIDAVRVQRLEDRIEYGVQRISKFNSVASNGEASETQNTHTQTKHLFSWWRLCRTFCVCPKRICFAFDRNYRCFVVSTVVPTRYCSYTKPPRAAQPKNKIDSFFCYCFPHFFLSSILCAVVDWIKICVNKITSKWTFLVYFSRQLCSRATHHRTDFDPTKKLRQNLGQ